MKLRRDTNIQAKAEEVWQVLGPDFNHAYLWASSINHSKGIGTNGRICDTELGEFRETVELYDNDSKRIAYSAKGDKMPFFVKRMQNQWHVEENGIDRCIVTMEMHVTLSFPFNLLMTLPMRLQLGRVVKEVHEELKYYVEHNGKVHPRKHSTLEQYKKKLTMNAS